ncbi:MAG: hypothetical protein J1E81_07815 [Eubacterium sp.]|nr:hypothetical protein [Eubacterium sp.]
MRKKLNKIIKKALKQTIEEFEDSSPVIYQHFFYGAVDLAPQNLVVWYLFAKDKELQAANENGLCNKLNETTIRNLIAAGYPAEAFSEAYYPLNGKITFQGGTKDEINDVIYSLTHRKAKVAFTTQEDIDRKAHGDYHLYFQ